MFVPCIIMLGNPISIYAVSIQIRLLKSGFQDMIPLRSKTERHDYFKVHRDLGFQFLWFTLIL